MKPLPAYLNTIKQYRFLWLVIVVQAVGFLVVAAMLPFEVRTINNVNLWLKPLKFLFSTSLYLITIPYYLELTAYSCKQKHLFANIAAGAMLLENIAITGQAARGVMSHFNITSPANMMIFNAMGIAILINTIMLAILMVGFFRIKNHADRAMIIACRYGLVLMLIAAVGGGFMSLQLHHSIGAADNSSGMPLTNWNRTGGDLRVMHFFGIHAMQILPLIVLCSGKNVKLRTVHFSGIAFGALVVFAFVQALRGEPFAVRKTKHSASFFQNNKQFTSLPGCNGIVTRFHSLDGEMLAKN